MTDLNLAATLTDGGGTQPFTNPTYANDNDIATLARVNSFAGSGTHTAYLISDLGSAAAVDTHVIYGDDDCDGTPSWVALNSVDYSTDGVSWTPVSGYSTTYAPASSAADVTTPISPVLAAADRLRGASGDPPQMSEQATFPARHRPGALFVGLDVDSRQAHAVAARW